MDKVQWIHPKILRQNSTYRWNTYWIISFLQQLTFESYVMSNHFIYFLCYNFQMKAKIPIQTQIFSGMISPLINIVKADIFYHFFSAAVTTAKAASDHQWLLHNTFDEQPVKICWIMSWSGSLKELLLPIKGKLPESYFVSELEWHIRAKKSNIQGLDTSTGPM